MANLYDDNDDLRWYVEKGIDWEPLVRLTEYDYRSEGGFENCAEAVDFYKDVLDLVGAFTADEIAAHHLALDACHPRLEDGDVVYDEPMASLLQSITDLELYGLTIPRELGGLNAPMLVFHMTTGLFAQADVSVCAHYGFHGGIAMAAVMFSASEGSTHFDPELPGITETRFSELVDSIVAGEAWGCMDITEPDAGSDMANLSTKGEQDEDGNWFVTGQKIFITSGHGRWHFVIARTEPKSSGDDAFAGLKGLSMFLVPAYEIENGEKVRKHTSLDGLEEKLGHHGSATVAISFDRCPAHLVGERGEGFKYMLHLMNGARVGVGFEALGLCEAAYRNARAYAAERPSMGKTIDQHEMIADMLDEARTDIQGIRALAVAAGFQDELARKIELKLQFMPPESTEERGKLERQMRRLQKRSRHLTPLLKYLAAEKAVEIARRGVQIHGGVGYCVEYGAERLLRDAMVMPIYEGTSQIQALMAMKDNLMNAVKKPRRFVRDFTQARWRAMSSRDPHERRVAKLQVIQYQAVQFLLSRLAVAKLGELRHAPMESWSGQLKNFDPKKDFALAMLHAEKLCIILTDVAVAEELLAQGRKDVERYEVLDRWMERAEPRCRHQLDLIQTTGGRLLDALRGHQADEATDAVAAK